jgi:hypothetical protein
LTPGLRSHLDVDFVLGVGFPAEERSAAVTSASVLASAASSADERLVQPSRTGQAQGCQIFLDSIYRNGANLPNGHRITLNYV